MQAVLFEIQLLKSKESEFEAALEGSETQIKAKTGNKADYEDFESQGGPEFSRDDAAGALPKDKRPSQGLRSILLKGEMRYLKDVNMLVFLCSPL